MGWQRDGSGLLVYRHRGRTVRQTATPMCESGNARNLRRQCGWYGTLDVCARGWFSSRQIRKRQKDRRRKSYQNGGDDMPF